MNSFRRSAFIMALALGIGLAFGMGCESVSTRSMKIYMQQQNWPKALEQGRTAVAENPNDAEAWFALAQVAAQVDSFNLMLHSMERADALSNVHDAEIREIRTVKYNQVFNNAVAKYNANDMAAAIDRLQLAIRIDEARANAYKVLGMVQQRNNQIPQAIENYRKAYEADTSDVAVGRAYANLISAAGQKDRAITLMERLYLAHPGDKEVALSYMALLETANRVDSALVVAKDLIAREPADEDVNMRAGVLYMRKAQTAEDTAAIHSVLRLSIPYFQQVLTTDSANTDAAYNLAIAFQQMGQPEEAVRPLKQVVRLNPGDHQARLQLATVLLQQDKADEAEPELQAVIRGIGEPKNAEERGQITRAYRFLQIVYTHRGNTRGEEAQRLREAATNARNRVDPAKLPEIERVENESRQLLEQAREYERLYTQYND